MNPSFPPHSAPVVDTHEPPSTEIDEPAASVRISAALLDAARAVQQHHFDRLAALRSDDPPSED